MEDAILSKEALRKSEEKYRTLFESIDEGFCIIEMIYNEAGKATNYRFLEVNQSFERQTGVKNVIGKTGKDLTPDNEPYWMDAYNKVVQTGKVNRFENYHEPTSRWYEVYASRVDGVDSGQVAIVFNDITQRKKAEIALRESGERKAFLLKLSDMLRPVSDPVSTEEIVTRLAMDHFRADRCYYCEIVANRCVIRRDALKDGFVSVAGEYCLEDIPILKSVIGAGKPFIVHDISTTDLVDESLRQLCMQLQVISFIDVPVVKNGVPVGVLCIVQDAPRVWAEFEIELAEEVAERTWSAVERAKAEATLHESDERRAFQLRLSDALRPFSDPLEIQKEALRQVGQYLDADRVMYNEIDRAVTEYTVRVNYLREGFEGHLGRFSIRPFTQSVKDLRMGKTEVIYDVEADDRLSKEAKDICLGMNVRSFVVVPLVKEGIWIWNLVAHYSKPRKWTQHEISILEETAERTWAAVERAKAEKALQESENRLRTLADAVPQVIWTNNAEGRAIYFNQRWYQYTGLTYEQSASLGWQAVVHPDDAPASVEKWKKSLIIGEIFDTEYRLRGSDGTYRWFIGRNVPLKDNAGKVTRWFGSATDIEDLKRTAEALSQSEAKLKITMESATDYAIITMDTERRIERWSSGAAQLFNYIEAEVIGQSADIIFTEEDRQAGAPQKEMETARDAGRAADERWHVAKNGSRFFMSGVMRPIYNPMLTGYVKVARDVTEQQLFTEELHRLVAERTIELQRSNDDLRQFAHVASHDLKEPVRKIKTFNTRIIDDFSNVLPDKVKKYLTKIESSTDRMYAMIEGVLNYSKAGSTEQPVESVDLNEIIRDILTDLEVLVQQKNAQITTANLPRVEGYSVLLYQLFYNLILNSLKFAKASQPSHIHITCDVINKGEAKFYQIVLSDNGIGFEQEYAEAIFSTFTRLNPADDYEGTGLGLALCKKIVDRHKGTISAAGELDKGASFTIMLPVL